MLLPFGIEPNDLALDAISRMIESSLREMTGEAPLAEIKTGGFVER